MDPRKFKNDEEYSFAMKTAWAFAKAADEVISFVDNSIQEAEMLLKKEKGELTPKTIN